MHISIIVMQFAVIFFIVAFLSSKSENDVIIAFHFFPVNRATYKNRNFHVLAQKRSVFSSNPSVFVRISSFLQTFLQKGTWDFCRKQIPVCHSVKPSSENLGVER